MNAGPLHLTLAAMVSRRFMVSLSNHEAVRTAVGPRPSWFDRLTMKAARSAVP